MSAGGLLAAFVLAKVVVLASHVPGWSPWAPVAYLWQDVLVVIGLAAVDMTTRRIGLSPRVGRMLYWGMVVYAALSIPVGRALATPLTWPMLRATRGPLADSILLYATWTNAMLMASTIAVAAAPVVWRRRITAGLKSCATSTTSPTRTAMTAALGVGAFMAVVGPVASARVDTRGLDRNVLLALVASALPRMAAHPGTGDWRRSRFDQDAVEDLSALRAIAGGRNVVFVSLESTAAQYLPLYGGEPGVAPHLGELARDAIVFEHAYAAYPESIKGLFSILCSVFPVFDSTPDLYARVPCQPLPGVLLQQGYRTGLFHSGRFDYLGMQSIIRDRGYQTLEDAGDIGGVHDSSFGVDEPTTVSRMLAWVDATPKHQPFFLTYLPIAGHHPYETPERGPFPDADEIGRYRNALHYGDAALGALVDGFRARGLAERTLWIVIGDHGEAFGQHEGNYGHTFFLYDENVRVPLVIAAPWAIQRPARPRKVVSLVDLAPTILDLLGISVPADYQGRSALDGTPRMALFFADYSLGLVGLRDGQWKFVHELGSKRSRLFNLEHNPQETLDISSSHEDRASWYRQHLLDWSAAQKAYVRSLALAHR